MRLIFVVVSHFSFFSFHVKFSSCTCLCICQYFVMVKLKNRTICFQNLKDLWFT